MRTLSCLSLLLLGLALTQAAALHQTHQEWREFKSTYTKEYASEEEEQSRFAIFLDNKRIIVEHNALYDSGEISWELGMNEFGDLTEEEFKARYLGQVLPKENKENCQIYRGWIETPDSYDWRNEGAVTEVKDQGFCGSCWSFAATGSMEGQYYRGNGELVSMSEQNLLDCAQNWGCNGGGRSDITLKYVHENGTNSEAAYPYEMDQDSCRQSSNDPIYHCSGCTYTIVGSEDDLRMALVDEGPVAVAIDASPLNFMFYRSGIIDDPDCGTDYPDINHAVLAVGYDSEANGIFGSKAYWIIKNSWGKSWGSDGYFNLAKDKHNMCGVSTDTALAKAPCYQA
ncbi:unnamed protein product [Meganyctiphanes norvegica]|uniref:Cathepsin L n=1 Tax=Meganyctiphanes norvegica TaxID=48144 RepID=A0AAV2SIC1_MEGNR